MKTRIAALVTAGVLALSMLTGCGSKQESWKVTCPWAPSGVAAMVSQKAAAKSPDYSDNKITLVAEAVKGDADGQDVHGQAHHKGLEPQAEQTADGHAF